MVFFLIFMHVHVLFTRTFNLDSRIWYSVPKIIMVKAHVECSSELVWQCVKKNNAYVRASVNRTRMSAEKGNVTAKHGFSSSGKT